MPTLAEIAQVRQVPLSAGIFRAVYTETPALMAFDARTTSRKKFKTLALTGLPTAGGFVDYNEGFTSGKASLKLREFDAKLTGGKVQVERITAQEWDQENENGKFTYFDLQLYARMKTELKNINSVLFYGTGVDAKGFPGMKELTPYVNVLSLTDDPGADDYVKTVINAGGSSAGTASSVYSVVFGEMEAQLVLGNDQGGEMFTMSEIIEQHIAPDSDDPDATLVHDVTQIWGYFGLSVGGMNQTPNDEVPTQYSVRRLANLTEDSGKGVTDAKLEQLVLSHGDNKMPSMLFMNGRSGRQWADSRSATSVSVFLNGPGDAKNNQVNVRAPRPTNFDGIPVTYDSAIRSTDAIEA